MRHEGAQIDIAPQMLLLNCTVSAVYCVDRKARVNEQLLNKAFKAIGKGSDMIVDHISDE